MNETPFKMIFLINEIKIYTKSEGIDVANDIDFHVLTLALGLFLPWD